MKLRTLLEPRAKLSVSPRIRAIRIGGISVLVFISILLLTNIPSSGPDQVISIQGKEGSLSVEAVDTVLNQYTTLAADAASGDVAFTISDINDLSNGTALSSGDLVLVIQMQGASINTTNDSTFGAITSYNNAGNYEFAYVSGTTGNQIELSCGLLHNYTASGHTQVIRVPQYTTLTVINGASVIAPAWDGSTGGVVAIVAENVITINGTIDVSEAGFRGGVVDNTSSYNQRGYFYSSASSGGEKGEGIAGYHTEYDAIGARYGRGAAANGGGGGNAHNSGGGGGANGNNGNDWNGQGVMCQTCTGSSAWQLDSGYIKYGNTYTTSSGGGRGGYSYGSSNQDALTVAPENSSWGGDNRRQLGGMGGRPVANDPAQKIFMGGGGGAGDMNNSAAQDGASGGGIVFLVADEVLGTGNISASGGDADPTQSGHNDGPGGGGAGGSILIKANYASGPALYAEGGKGGDQLITGNESEGPGGGGGGGFIAIPSLVSLTTSVAGGSGGTTYSASVTEFPANGSTNGGSGQLLASLPYIPFCAALDHDGDGIGDDQDLDDDNDGIPDWKR